MAEKPILFNTPMVQAIQDLRKRMTRRPVRDKTFLEMVDAGFTDDFMKLPDNNFASVCRYQVGDILYVRETFCYHKVGDWYGYRADGDYRDLDLRWRPSIHMPKEAARLFLRVTGVMVERLQEITEEDALAEGFEPVRCGCFNRGAWGCTDCMNTGMLEPAMLGFVDTWNDIYAKRGYGWEQNPWVEVTEFERVTP